jgi:hypothetical protein
MTRDRGRLAVLAGVLVLGGVAVLECTGRASAAMSGVLSKPRAAPPLPSNPRDWIGEPASWASLRGRVTLLFVWTFG